MKNQELLQNIPEELKSYPYFCLWRYDEKEGKVPYNPNNPRYKGSPTNKSKYASFTKTLSASKDSDGIGVGVFDDLCAIDIDACIDDNGNLDSRAQDIIATFNSYTEKSPSGKGIRIIFYAPGFSCDKYKDKYYINKRDKVPADFKGTKKPGLEIYVAGITNKFLSITGDTLNISDTVKNCVDVLPEVLDKYMIRETATSGSNSVINTNEPPALEDFEIIATASKAKNADKFLALWHGKRPAGDESVDDASLCSMLAFYAGGNAEVVERLFYESPHYKTKLEIKGEKHVKKCERKDYLPNTIKNAILSLKGTFYNPEYKSPVDAPAMDSNSVINTEGGLMSDNLVDYIKNIMPDDKIAFLEGAGRLSGFKELDDFMGSLYSGLYVLGGASSLGKTTFLWQIADNLARAGHHVIYFSLEQSRFEMVGKSIARLYAMRYADILNAPDNTDGTLTPGNLFALEDAGLFSALDFRVNLELYDPLIFELVDEYKKSIGNRLTVIEGNFDCTVDYIRDYVAKYIEIHGIKPVVMVDYLQIIDAPQKKEIRESVDHNVTELKRLSRNYNIAVVVISSFNRESYTKPVDFSSFKESGGIEYSADVVWGLQFKCAGGGIFKHGGQEQRKNDIIKREKGKAPRLVQLCVLKNRFGESGDISIDFMYYSKYDTYFDKHFLYYDYKADMPKDKKNSPQDPGDNTEDAKTILSRFKDAPVV